MQEQGNDSNKSWSVQRLLNGKWYRITGGHTSREAAHSIKNRLAITMPNDTLRVVRNDTTTTVDDDSRA